MNLFVDCAKYRLLGYPKFCSLFLKYLDQIDLGAADQKLQGKRK